MLLHGFPESWYSWRHQLTALAAAGFHAVAPDQRGYGQTRTAGRGRRVHDPAPGRRRDRADGRAGRGAGAVVAGHDWGAPVAWHTALLRPDRVRGVVGAERAVPAAGQRARRSRRCATGLGEASTWCYFQQPGRRRRRAGPRPAADVPQAALQRGRRQPGGGLAACPPAAACSTPAPSPAELPGWLTEEDIGSSRASSPRPGFTGALNWYRNLDRNWELTSAWQDAPITVPALFMAGDRDRGDRRLRRPQGDRPDGGVRARPARTPCCCPAAGTGPSRNGPPRSTRR